MATEKTAVNPELDGLAFDIYKQRCANGQGGEQIAIDSYRKATDFIAVRAKMQTGQLNPAKPEGIQADYCRAPNQPKTHPHNLVASNGGDLARVARINAWLNKNPTPESDPNELIPRLRSAFPELSWDLPTINIARQTFPAYCAASSN